MPAPNTLVYGGFEVYDPQTSLPVTGLLSGSFESYVELDGTPNAAAVTITETGDGRYAYSFTPTSAGHWSVLITHQTYNKRGWFEDFFVVASGGRARGGDDGGDDYWGRRRPRPYPRKFLKPRTPQGKDSM